MDRQDATEALTDVLEPNLSSFCAHAGREDAYERVQTALYRYRKGNGKGIPEQDVGWIVEQLEHYE